jgi:hypothetical protein
VSNKQAHHIINRHHHHTYRAWAHDVQILEVAGLGGETPRLKIVLTSGPEKGEMHAVLHEN